MGQKNVIVGIKNGLLFALFFCMKISTIKKLFIINIILTMLYALPGLSAEREYVVPMIKAKWISAGKPSFECSLSQTIPFYGEGKFIHKSGRDVVFNLLSKVAMISDVNIIIQSEPPSWRNGKVFTIGQFVFQQGKEPLVIGTPFASRMLQEIENGMSPQVIYRDLADGRDIISVLLSPIKFRESFKDYLECEKTLLDFDLEEIKNLKLYFATNKSTLSERSKLDLRNIKRYLALDSSILQIKIDAHADSRGRRRMNDKLSEARSMTVKNFLLKDGIKAAMIYTVGHGERAPTFTNKTSIGRAKNRRADVQLLTTAPPTPEEQEAMEKATKAERRKKLFNNSIYKDVPKKPLRRKLPASSDDTKPIAAKAVKPEPVDDEPPAPNFINLEHLVTPNK